MVNRHTATSMTSFFFAVHHMKLYEEKVTPTGRFSKERYDMLTSLGLSSKLDKNLHNVQWESKFEELLDYHANHGHCDVKTTSGGLGKWVSKQRSLHVKKTEGKLNAVETSRYQGLEEIGFSFQVGKGNRRNHH